MTVIETQTEQTIIDPSAKIAEDVVIGPWTQIGPNVEIDSGTVIGSHVVIHKNTKIGKNNKIYSFSSVGGDTQDVSEQDKETYLVIGDNNIIREFTTLNRGSSKDNCITKIGNRNVLMAYVHVAHDCIVGNDIIFANSAQIAGHVIVDDHVVLGAFTGIHQFVHVGAYSFLGRATKINKDILPFMLVTGNPGAPKGLNLVGLKRHNFSETTIRALKKAYSLIIHRNLKMAEIAEQLKAMAQETSEINLLINMIESSERGVAR